MKGKKCNLHLRFVLSTHSHTHRQADALARSNTHTGANSDELALVDRKMSHLLRGDSKQPSGGGKLPRIGRTQWLPWFGSPCASAAAMGCTLYTCVCEYVCVCVGLHVCICKWGMKLAFYLHCFMGALLARSLSL